MPSGKVEKLLDYPIFYILLRDKLLIKILINEGMGVNNRAVTIFNLLLLI